MLHMDGEIGYFVYPGDKDKKATKGIAKFPGGFMSVISRSAFSSYPN